MLSLGLYILGLLMFVAYGEEVSKVKVNRSVLLGIGFFWPLIIFAATLLTIFCNIKREVYNGNRTSL